MGCGVSMAKGPKPIDWRIRAAKWIFPEPNSGCWLWAGSVNGAGYGTIGLGRGNMKFVHRLTYVDAHGPIPPGTELDHKCSIPQCVNPDHLEAVTHRENCLRGRSPIAGNARKTHCKRGHPLSGDNLNMRRRGGRECLICRRALNEIWERANRRGLHAR